VTEPTTLDLDYLRDETIRIVNRLARGEVVESTDITWLARTIATLIAEVESHE
jgi:hypothetical protein